MLPTPRPLLFLALVLSGLALAGVARAAGGHYVIDGGTAAEQGQVRAALDASAFDWDLVPPRIAVHIVRGHASASLPGQIWLDADLLDAGSFSWGIVQHEYAHQVDFFLLDNTDRQRLVRLLGAADWCYEIPGLDHARHGCERFASTLAWAYWPSAENALRPQSPADESAGMAPAAFRAMIDHLLGSPGREASADPSSPGNPQAPVAAPQRLPGLRGRPHRAREPGPRRA